MGLNAHVVLSMRRPKTSIMSPLRLRPPKATKNTRWSAMTGCIFAMSRQGTRRLMVLLLALAILSLWTSAEPFGGSTYPVGGENGGKAKRMG